MWGVVSVVDAKEWKDDLPSEIYYQACKENSISKNPEVE